MSVDRIISTDVQALARQHFVSEDGNKIRLIDEQDVTGILDSNAEERKYADKRTRFGDLQRVASIPLVVYAELRRKGILKDSKAMKRWLNDPENLVFRTRPGRV